MRETPPYSLAEIRMLLSQYIDGAMEADQMLALEGLLAQFSDYQAEFLKLQATCGLIHQSMEKQTEAAALSPEPHALWQTIASQLEADRQTPSQSFEPEWISAYLDGEIPAQDTQRQTFEGQLSSNAEANQLLWELGHVSEMIRQFGYRLENACTLELSAQVMTTWMAEQASGLDSIPLSDQHPDQQPVDAEWELLSVFVDQALSPREIMEATRLIESSESARARLLRLNQLSEGIQRVSQQVQDQAPDVWPPVRDALQTLGREQNIVPLHRPLRLHWVKRAAIPIAAGMLLVFLFLPNLHWTPSTPANEAAPSTATSANKGASSSVQAMGTQPAQAQELASVPPATIEARRANYVMPSDSAVELPLPVLTTASSKPESAPRTTTRLKPMFDSAPVLANANTARDSGSSASQTDAVSPHKAPTSEAYLFDALNKQMPEEDISNIIGK